MKHKYIYFSFFLSVSFLIAVVIDSAFYKILKPTGRGGGLPLDDPPP